MVIRETVSLIIPAFPSNSIRSDRLRLQPVSAAGRCALYLVSIPAAQPTCLIQSWIASSTRRNCIGSSMTPL